MGWDWGALKSRCVLKWVEIFWVRLRCIEDEIWGRSREVNCIEDETSYGAR